ncbi:hypothetical protein ACQ4M3_31780 [Leptolyngbya sp. AN03gr2]|uniref:hypothetical protein n=1 Tax=unclassified Leptolyngbya TaxID=2650499 RepID=UPI003D31629C
MLEASEALQQATVVTNADGQAVVQINLAAWEAIHAAIQPDEENDAIVLKLFLDFITTEALKSKNLQPYTAEMSETAHHLIAGVTLDDE